jgi:hypothetical protein
MDPDPDPEGQFITIPPDQDPQHRSFFSLTDDKQAPEEASCSTEDTSDVKFVIFSPSFGQFWPA